MASRITQDRNARISEVAATLGATVVDSGEVNEWDVAVAGKRVGAIRFDARARVWLATTGTGSTVGDLAGCLRFVIRRY